MKPRIIALYLPQFHPIPENDKWWGKGFTEWTNVVKAKPMFKGHYQPHLPADLGFYDLRLPEVREQQAELAKEAGIEGFCYYHYWFGNGKQLLERPFNEVLASEKPDFPFCICWANHDWTNKSWKKGLSLKKASTIMKMEYSKEDHIKHFYHLLPAFLDERYIKVDGKPLFAVWAPRDIPEETEFIETWQKLAKENGLQGIHFVGYTPNASKGLPGESKNLYATDRAADYYKSVLNKGYDAVISSGLIRAEAMAQSRMRLMWNILSYTTIIPTSAKLDYSKVMENYYVEEDSWEYIYPTLLPQWDRTPRAGSKTDILTNSTPEKFETSIINALNRIKNKQEEHQILFLKAWNEWGEGNYVEPDSKYGHGWLNAIKKAIKSVE